MSNYGIRPINRSCGSYGCHCPPNDGRQNTADMPDTTPWRDRGDYYILPKDDPVAALKQPHRIGPYSNGDGTNMDTTFRHSDDIVRQGRNRR